MQDDWFNWERGAAIHAMYPTLEGSMKPLEKFTGHGFPLTILIFKDGIVAWRIKNTEFYGLGVKLLEIYKNEKKEREMVQEGTKRLGVLKKIEGEIDSVKISDLTNEELVDLYNKLHLSFINYYGVGAIQEPLAMQAEVELKEISKLSSDKLVHLIVPNKFSYIQEADNYLIETKNIEGFIKRYYWIDNNYSQTKILSKKDVEKRMSHIKLTKSLGQGSQSLELKTAAKRLVQLLKNFAIYQDERKRNILIYLHYLEILLGEIGKRSNLSLKMMRETFPHEIKEILDGKITENFIEKRRKNCFVVWEERAENPTILVDEETRQWEKIFISKTNNSRIIKGNCASKGKAIGKVRVLLNASENDKLQEGEVLVTFMTSPDFMSAVRRCSAIVTNSGGITSHAAIISRELGIPCVVGTKNATEILKTGDLVEVDADKGIVRLIK
ncbi:MAG: PEP-utilizers protein [Candidatus Levybacteria bacterium]|nr:PEP-utilizers protein [Candidatus Levybacteria bacterium]